MICVNNYFCLFVLIVLLFGCGRMDVQLTGKEIGVTYPNENKDGNGLIHNIKYIHYINPDIFGINRHQTRNSGLSAFINLINFSNDTLFMYFDKYNTQHNDFGLIIDFQGKQIRVDLNEFINKPKENIIYPGDTVLFYFVSKVNSHSKMKKYMRNFDAYVDAISNSKIIYKANVSKTEKYKKVFPNHKLIESMEFEFSKDTEISYYR